MQEAEAGRESRKTVGELSWKKDREQNKKPGMFPVTVAWWATDKRALHSPGLQPSQTNKPIIQQPSSPYSLILTLLVRQATSKMTHHLFPTLLFPLGAGYQCVRYSGGAETNQIPTNRAWWHGRTQKCNTGLWSLQQSWWFHICQKVENLTSYKKKNVFENWKIERLSFFLLESWNTIWMWIFFKIIWAIMVCLNLKFTVYKHHMFVKWSVILKSAIFLYITENGGN